jgi:hypothetical protein
MSKPLSETDPLIGHVASLYEPSQYLSFGEEPHLKSVLSQESLVLPQAFPLDGKKQMPLVQSLSETPSEVQKTAKKVNAWSVIWRALVTFFVLGAWGWVHLYNTYNDPDSQLIRSLEAPIQTTYTVGTPQEDFINSSGRPVIGYEINERAKVNVVFPDGESIPVIREVDELLKQGFRTIQVLDLQGRDIDQYDAIRLLNDHNKTLDIRAFIPDHPFIAAPQELLHQYAENGMNAIYQYDSAVEDAFVARLPKGQESSLGEYLAAYDGPNREEFQQAVEQIFKQYPTPRTRYYEIIDLFKVEPIFDKAKEVNVCQLVQHRANALGAWAGVSGKEALRVLNTSNPVSVLQVLLKEHLRHPFTQEEYALYRPVERNGGHCHAPEREDMQVRLLPMRQGVGETVYPLRVSWKIKVNFADGTANTYVLNQDIEIRKKGKDEPCEVTIHRTTNAPAYF